MPQPRSKFPLRVRHAGTDPIHAAREYGTKGHDTPCWLWLDPADPHIWCEDNAEITCTKCIEHLASEPMDYAPLRIPKTGTLHERLVTAVAEEIRHDSDMAWRISETVEVWRQEVEDRIRLVVEGTLAGAIPWPARATVADTLVARVLQSMAIGDSAASEGVEK